MADPDETTSDESAKEAREARKAKRRERSLAKEPRNTELNADADDKAPKKRKSARRDEEQDDDGEPHGKEDRERNADEKDDPTWWAPHAVLLGLILVGLFGYFGGLGTPH